MNQLNKENLAVRYYDAFKKLDTSLTITAIYTYGANEESVENQEHSRHALERIIANYNKDFGTNLSTEMFASYFKHVDSFNIHECLECSIGTAVL